jgi:hypothetical protein
MHINATGYAVESSVLIWFELLRQSGLNNRVPISP